MTFPDRISFKQVWPGLAALALGVLWILATAEVPGSAVTSGIPAPQKGFFGPDFRLESNQGQPLSLSEFRGQAVLVNLWASWCGPCRAEMPAMERVYQEYKERGFTILAVNATNQDSQTAALAFVQEHNLTYPILFDYDGRVSQAYQLRALPSSFFIGPDGVIAEVVIGGPMAEALLRTRVESLLTDIP